MKASFLFVFIALIHICGYSQLRIDTTLSPERLIREVLLNVESDVIIKNIHFKGKKESICSFINDSPEVLMDQGIILSTGSVFDAKGPNEDSRTGRQMSGMKDINLQAIATGVVTDAVSLEFDLIGLKDSIVFEYVFASEEYPEYVGTGVNDVFAFFISEVGGNAINPINLALVPGTRHPVSIDNINHRINEEFFLRSDFFSSHSVAYWENHIEIMQRAAIFEFDGFTIPLKAVFKLKEGQTYHLKLTIADVGDRIVDSAVLLKAKSFSSNGERIEKADSIVKNELDNKLSGFKSSFLLNDDLSFSILVNFNTNESIILQESYQILNKLSGLLLEFQDLELEIIGHTDNVGTDESNLKLSKERAVAVKLYLINKGTQESRLNTDGVGESQPSNTNESEEGRALNRRVEFKFSY